MAESDTSGDRIAGGAMLAGVAITLLAMAHHPTSAHAGPIGPVVHAAMIAVVSTTTFAFAHFSRRRGLGRPAVLAGLVAYAVALFGHVGAATISGFIVPALAGHGGGAISHDLFLFAWESNQALANLGVAFTSAAFLLWSLDFLGRGGAEPRLIGLAGLLAAVVPAVLIAGGWMTLDVRGAFIAYAVHGAWIALVGLHLLRGGLVPVSPQPGT